MKIGKILSAGNIRKKSSIKLMDEFESTIDGVHKYDTLVFGRIMNLMDEEVEGNPEYDISLYVQRCNKDDEILFSDITFTKLKRELYNCPLDTLDEYDGTLGEVLQKNIIESFKKNRDLFKKKKDNIIFFDTPITFSAQNSSNRTGYGNEYYGDMLVHEGTKYGETTLYTFVGMRVILREYQNINGTMFNKKKW